MDMELMLLFNSGLPRLTDKLSLISNEDEGHDYKTEGGHVLNSWLTTLLFLGEMPICSPDFTFKCL